MKGKIMKINLFNYTISIFNKKRKYKIKSLNAPTSLNTPTARSGYIHRWLSAETLSIANKRSKKVRSSYELVKANKHRNRFPVIDKGRFKGFIGVGGLVLAAIPKKMVEARREYLKEVL